MQLTSSVTQKGQVTIPAEIRKLLGVKPQDKVAFKIEKSTVKLSRTTSVVERTKGILASPGPRFKDAREERKAAEEAIAEEAMKRMGS